jgi:mono/diheme cytochrome c family protein
MNQLFLILGSAALISCGNVNSSNTDGNEGKTVYKTYCVSCHGPKGKLMLNDSPDLSVSKMTLEERLENIRKGGSMMPAFEEVLSEEQIQAVAVYLDELKESE